MLIVVLAFLGCEYKDEHAACKWACHKKYGASVGDAIVDGYFIGRHKQRTDLYCKCIKYLPNTEIGSVLLNDNEVRVAKPERE